MNSADIINAVSEVFEVPPGVLSSRSLQREVVDARYVAYHLLIRELRFAPKRVAQMMRRDRSMYAHALKVYDDLYATNTAFRRRADAVMARLGLGGAL